MGQVAVPMMRRLLTQGGLRLAACRYLDAGSESSLVWPAAQLAVSDFSSLNKNADGGARAPDTQSGVYAAGNRMLCFNRSAAENDTVMLSSESAAHVLGDVRILAFEATHDDAAIHTEIWRAALILMLLCLAVEAWLLVPPKAVEQTDVKKGFHS